MRKKVCYISGPMSGYPNNYFELFDEVAEFLKSEYVVINPAEIERGKLLTWQEAMLADFKVIVQQTNIDDIVLLPNWEKSKGAKIEIAFITEIFNANVKILEKNGSIILLKDFKLNFKLELESL